MSFPPCFNSLKEHQEWKTLARRTTKQVNWPCVDCTLEYQQRMIEAGRCQHPDAMVGHTQPRKSNLCPAPSAVAKPEASSGKSLETAEPRRKRSPDSARDTAKSFIKPCAKRKPKVLAGARSCP
jgi:hypothetical protein